jgi:hypothetical protein
MHNKRNNPFFSFNKVTDCRADAPTNLPVRW